MELVPPQSHACPGCQTMVVQPQTQNFCTGCGLPLKQPCPHCSSSLPTPGKAFTNCPECATGFWACRACGRIYNLDRTSCENSYCPDEGRFWTRNFGEDTWCSANDSFSVVQDEDLERAPTPAWVSETSMVAERRWPNLHRLGLLISVQESGVLELWSEHGAPQAGEVGDFAENGVCLSRLDLGEIAPCAPLLHQNEVVLPGATGLALLELTANPAVGSRIPLPETPHSVLSLGSELLIWGGQNLLLGDLRSGDFQEVAAAPGQPKFPLLSDHRGGALLVGEEGVFFFHPDSGLKRLDSSELTEPEWVLHAGDRFLLVRRKTLAYQEEDAFHAIELNDSAIGAPMYCPHSERLFLMLNDQTIRSCTSTAERFSFISELAGTPTTVPLKIGERIFYGTEGRYLCRDEEALRPRLSSQPVGEFSYANGRVFGSTRDGGLFAFQL